LAGCSPSRETAIGQKQIFAISFMGPSIVIVVSDHAELHRLWFFQHKIQFHHVDEAPLNLTDKGTRPASVLSVPYPALPHIASLVEVSRGRDGSE
jgi:hypothetical protein